VTESENDQFTAVVGAKIPSHGIGQSRGLQS